MEVSASPRVFFTKKLPSHASRVKIFYIRRRFWDIHLRSDIKNWWTKSAPVQHQINKCQWDVLFSGGDSTQASSQGHRPKVEVTHWNYTLDVVSLNQIEDWLIYIEHLLHMTPTKHYNTWYVKITIHVDKTAHCPEWVRTTHNRIPQVRKTETRNMITKVIRNTAHN